jgi:hypothetical protein
MSGDISTHYDPLGPYYWLNFQYPAYPKFINVNNWIAEPICAKVEYRILELQETIQEGDEECGQEHDDFRPVIMSWVGCRTSKYNTCKFRRPIRMQDARHRFLDIGETIISGDEYTCSASCPECWRPAINSIGFALKSVQGGPKRWRRKIEFPKTISTAATITIEGPPVQSNNSYRILQSGDIIQYGDEIIGGTSGIGDRYETWTKLKPDACCLGLDVDFYKNKFSFRRKVGDSKLQKEVNELKEKLRSTETAVSVYADLQKLLKTRYEVEWTVERLLEENGDLKEEIQALKTPHKPPRRIPYQEPLGGPQYIALGVGDVIQPGDEYRINRDFPWVSCTTFGDTIDKTYQCEYRRKVK